MSEKQQRRQRRRKVAIAEELANTDESMITMEHLPYTGNPDGAILVVCDVPTKKAWQKFQPIEGAQMRLFATTVQEYGLVRDDFAFVSPCPPLPDEAVGSAKRESVFIAKYRQALLSRIASHDPKLVVYMGGTAGRQVAGRQIKITRVRGQIQAYDVLNCPAVAMLSTGHILRRPEYADIFRTDALLLKNMKDNNWDVNSTELSQDHDVDYRWCTDLQFLIDMRPPSLAVDTETTGLRWYDPNVEVLTVQLTWEEGKSVVIPVHTGYYPDLNQRKRARLIQQLRTLMEDEDIIKAGHNLKFDCHQLREKLKIHVKSALVDTQLLAFAVDENMESKSLDDCIRRWVPAMAGYADAFNEDTDKSRMIDVDHARMCQYAGGDTDATFRLARVLINLLKEDDRQYNIYERILIPAITAFQDHVEPQGLNVDTEELYNLQVALDIRSKELFNQLMRLVPAAVKRKHMEKGLKFSRAAFVRDILFSDIGYNLTPVKFTKSTARLPPDERLPSTSAKDHLPYFEDEPFVALYMEYTRLEKMRGTYVGREWDEDKQAITGFWKYIHGGKVHPSYMLHRTNTGRTASSDPNGQNFPKRGALAKAYRKIFKAPEGYKLISCDLSQAELRIAAWMAGERNMIEIYRNDGDIHAATAASTMGMQYEEFVIWQTEEKDTPLHTVISQLAGSQSWLAQQPSGDRTSITVGTFLKAKRQAAKAINFGFLYGMGWRTFMTYAKTDYGVEFTEEEAKETRKTFFRTYPRLAVWHETMRGFVHEHGYVRALHGALRRLPSIKSNDEGMVALAERNAVNSPVQRFASDLGLMALTRLCRDVPKGLIIPVAFIHDDLVCIAREEHAEECAANLRWYMETPPLEEWFGIKPPLPIKGDAEIGYNLAEMDERPDIAPVRPEWAQCEKELEAA